MDTINGHWHESTKSKFFVSLDSTLLFKRRKKEKSYRHEERSKNNSKNKSQKLKQA
jgi:hypothetical protein